MEEEEEEEGKIIAERSVEMRERISERVDWEVAIIRLGWKEVKEGSDEDLSVSR